VVAVFLGVVFVMTFVTGWLFWWETVMKFKWRERRARKVAGGYVCDGCKGISRRIYFERGGAKFLCERCKGEAERLTGRNSNRQQRAQ
jgi:hypothetical protein